MYFWTVTQNLTTEKPTFRKLQNVATKIPNNGVIARTNFRKFCTESLQNLSWKVPTIVPLLGLLEASFAIFAFANIVVESPNNSPIIGTFRGLKLQFLQTQTLHCFATKSPNNSTIIRNFRTGSILKMMGLTFFQNRPTSTVDPNGIMKANHSFIP
jgi:hypothetical protein